MLYAHVKDGSIVEVTGKPRWFNDDAQQLSDQELLSLNVYPVHDTPPSYNPITHFIDKRGKGDWIIGNDKVEVTYLVSTYSSEQIKSNLLLHAERIRYQKETSGAEIAGQIIDTTRDSQSMITGAYKYAQDNPDKVIEFKAASGWVTLDAATMMAIGKAVGDHVQACFAKESQVAKDIESGLITTAAEIEAAFETL
ncbi:DUF4376 domain-containing protein [Brucella tritici]|nr:DUF4376 domain-containing protein [Brucella tritici]